MLIFKVFVPLFKIILNKKVANPKTLNIFNYEFECYTKGICTSNCSTKEKCCKKFKKKGKKQCKNCPKLVA